MIYFSPAKINLGLQVLKRRADGFHEIRSVMYPVGLCDIVEIHRIPGKNIPLEFSQSGIRFEGDLKQNLCIKAWELLSTDCSIPPVSIHLHKQIPVGAGLGGGSSNASTVLKGLNLLAEKPVKPEKLAELAARLGSDCPFFLHNIPMMMEGRGEILSRVDISPGSGHLVLLFPEIHIPTAEAYGAVSPSVPARNLRELIEEPLDRWKEILVNDFEKSAFRNYPILGELKSALYKAGASYASMSGSGSSLFGIFKTAPALPEELLRYRLWQGPA